MMKTGRLLPMHVHILMALAIRCKLNGKHSPRPGYLSISLFMASWTMLRPPHFRHPYRNMILSISRSLLPPHQEHLMNGQTLTGMFITDQPENLTIPDQWKTPSLERWVGITVLTTPLSPLLL